MKTPNEGIGMRVLIG